MPYRDADRNCPACRGSLEWVNAIDRQFQRCDTCGGLWVSEATLQDMFREMTAPGREEVVLPFAPRDEPPGPAATAARPCPQCQEGMLLLELANVPVERCRSLEHGVWFDNEELEIALRGEAVPPLGPRHRVWRAMLGAVSAAGFARPE